MKKLIILVFAVLSLSSVAQVVNESIDNHGVRYVVNHDAVNNLWTATRYGESAPAYTEEYKETLIQTTLGRGTGGCHGCCACAPCCSTPYSISYDRPCNSAGCPPGSVVHVRTQGNWVNVPSGATVIKYSN